MDTEDASHGCGMLAERAYVNRIVHDPRMPRMIKLVLAELRRRWVGGWYLAGDVEPPGDVTPVTNS